jgi:hypothetical protein
VEAIRVRRRLRCQEDDAGHAAARRRGRVRARLGPARRRPQGTRSRSSRATRSTTRSTTRPCACSTGLAWTPSMRSPSGFT